MSQVFQIPGVDYDQTTPVMDREQIDMLLMVDDNEEDSTALVRELFDLFQGESAEKLESLDEVCAANDGDELRQLVHFVAGSAGNLGIARLSVFYRGVEQAIDEGRLTDLSGCAAPIRTAFEDGCKAFGAEFVI
jgi:HPt (histidine-containing phosphotransfer) domain-containing protein